MMFPSRNDQLINLWDSSKPETSITRYMAPSCLQRPSLRSLQDELHAQCHPLCFLDPPSSRKTSTLPTRSFFHGRRQPQMAKEGLTINQRLKDVLRHLINGPKRVSVNLSAK